MSLLSRFALQGATGAPGQTYWYAEFTNSYDSSATFDNNPTVYVQPGTGDIAVGLASGNDKAVLAKIDSDANVIWSRSFTNAGAPYYPRVERVAATYIDDSGNSYFFGEGNDSGASTSGREAQMLRIDSSNNVTLNVMPCDNNTYVSDYILDTVPVGNNFIAVQGSSATYTLINSSGVIQDRHDNPTILSTPDGSMQQASQNRADKRIVVDDSLIWIYGYYSSFSTLFTFNKSNFTRANGYYLKFGSNSLRGRSIAISPDGTKQAFTHTQPSSPNYYDMISFGSVSGGLIAYRNTVNYGAFRNNFAAFDEDNNVYWCFAGPFANNLTTNYLIKFNVDTGSIIFQREFVVDGPQTGGMSVNSMTIENDSLHITFGKGSDSPYSCMIKVPLNGTGTGTYGNQIPITYQETILDSLALANVTVNGPYSFTTTQPTVGNYNLDTSGMVQTTGVYSNSRLDEIVEGPDNTAAISQNVRQYFITSGATVDTERTVNANTGDLIIDQTAWFTHYSASPNILMSSTIPGAPDDPTELRTDDPTSGAKAWLTSYYKYSDMATDAEVWRWNQAITNQRNFRFTLTIPSAQYISISSQFRNGTTGWTPPTAPNLLAGDKIAITQVHMDASTQLFDTTQTNPNLETYGSTTVTSYVTGDSYPMINAVAVVPSNGNYQLPTFSFAGDYATSNFNIMLHGVVFRSN